jgi:hypothetical protein
MSSDSCLNKVATNCTSGFALGTMLGAVQATWTVSSSLTYARDDPGVSFSSSGFGLHNKRTGGAVLISCFSEF